jgi:hypothetical protein
LKGTVYRHNDNSNEYLTIGKKFISGNKCDHFPHGFQDGSDIPTMQELLNKFGVHEDDYEGSF